MGNETSERIEGALRAYNEDGVEAILPYIHPDFEMTTTTEVAAEPDTYRGHEGVTRYFESFLEIMDEVRVEPLEIEAHGDRGLIRFDLIARGKATGIEVVQKGFGIWEFEGDLVRRISFFPSEDEARAAFDSSSD
ncbi:MAG: nuclear transport factor 2 family protein [Actinomycetota bacterium]|nr:nuclear transport factor 2 family protein [Actinomycetota bacterium]